MKILFCNDCFPGRFNDLASLFASNPENEVLFASRYGRRNFSIKGVRRIILRSGRERKPLNDTSCSILNRAVSSGRHALAAFKTVRKSNFIPDIIFSTASGGYSLFLSKIYPDSYSIGYMQDSHPEKKAVEDDELDTSSDALLQSVHMLQCHLYFVLSDWQRKQLPPLVRDNVLTMPCAIDTAFFSRKAAEPFFYGDFTLPEGCELISASIKDINDMGVLQNMPVLLAVLNHRPSVHLCIVVGSPIIISQLEEICSGLPDALRERIHLLNFLPRDKYRDLLCATTLHLCLDALDLPINEPLEAMSCGAAVFMGKTPVWRGPLTPGKDFFVFPAEDNLSKARFLLRLLMNAEERRSVSETGTQTVLSNFSNKDVLPGYVSDLLSHYRKWKTTQLETPYEE